jgi:hypothetical protein
MDAATVDAAGKIILALVPCFAVGFAVQQALELLDPIITPITRDKDKKLAMSLLSLLIGFLVVAFGGLRILVYIYGECSTTNTKCANDTFDAIVSALFISAGTEGFNSLVKFVSYAKEEAKVTAGVKKKLQDIAATATVNRE